MTRIVVVPSLLRAVLDWLETTPTTCAFPRVWVTSGERLDDPLIARFRRQLPEALLLNLYGSTEVAADVTAHDLPSPASPGVGVIGKPISNVRIFVVDPGGALCSIGVSGEIYVAGAALCRGYLDSPSFTAERFVPDPFSGIPGGRMYRTGDLGRWNEQGELEFIGRADHQVKIRGFRIELGEVEAALASHTTVRSCVVVAREDTPGEKRLVAYIVPKDGKGSASTLREHLRARLPDYMVPTAFVMLGALPLTPSGKVDRSALPVPDGTRESDSAPFVAPCTPTEQTVVSVWEELLGVRPIGATDDFFALGGHSLLAVRFLSALKARLGAAPPMASIF